MTMLRQPAVDQDRARGRCEAGMVRASVLFALGALVAGTTALMGWGVDRNIARVKPLPYAIEPATLQADPAVTPAKSTPDAPTATQPTEQDESQQAYVTHGG